MYCAKILFICFTSFPVLCLVDRHPGVAAVSLSGAKKVEGTIKARPPKQQGHKQPVTKINKP